MEEKNYISQAGFDRLKQEYDQLYFFERPEVIKVVQWAASNGDRSENADYLYGKRRLREIDRKLSFLNKRLKNAVVVDYLHYPENHKTLIRFGAQVHLQCVDDKVDLILEKIITIVGVDEVDLEKNYVSWKSPLGSALIGKDRGDECVVRAPQGEITYEIIKFHYDLY